MTTEHFSKERQAAKNCILGALVADAASMGFHWLYSQKKIQTLAPTKPEFYKPLAEDYEGIGYFAHGGKVSGELSHYGEQCIVMLNALIESGGKYSRNTYQNAFRDHFGYGGEFSGYIDRPTKETLDNIYHFESESFKKINALPFHGDNQKVLLTKILAAAKIHEGTALRKYVKQLASLEDNESESLDYGLSLIEALDSTSVFHGSDDDQLPAISKLPALVSSQYLSPGLSECCDSAIKVTNNNERALGFGDISVTLLKELLRGSTLESAIDTSIANAGVSVRAYLQAAAKSDSHLLDLTKEYGLHCDIGCGTVSILHNLRTSSSYVEAIRNNIYAAGDNCGRSIILGAACGIQYGLDEKSGIPEEWINKLCNSEQILNKIDTLIDQLIAPETD